jgi:hypothetical protein
MAPALSLSLEVFAVKSRAWLGMVALSTLLVAAACQSGESPLAGGERVITQANHLDLSSPEKIGAALDYCLDDGTGQGNAAKTRYLNGIGKYNAGNIAGAQSDINQLLAWGYERYDLGKWQNPPCSDEDFVEIWTAVVQSVDIDLQIALDGCVCLTDGCTCISNTDCAGVVLPNPTGEVYYVSFDDIPFDPFLVTPAGFNLYDQWADFHVVDINGDPVSFEGVPAEVAVYLQDLNTNLVTEEQVRLGHVKDGVMEILPPGQVTFALTCTDAGVASASFFDQVASIFQVTPLYAAGTKSGLLSSFSPVGPLDPHSDTRVGISPTTSAALTDGQTRVLTATVEGVTAYDTNGQPYAPTALQEGTPIEFYLDDGTEPFLTGAIGANGQASLSLTCGSDIDSGDHTVHVVYPATATHAASSTADADSPTGPATVTCTTPFTVINFDRDPDGNPLKNGEIVNTTYAPPVVFSRTGGNGTCTSANVFAVSDPNAGNFGSPPRVVALCPTSSSINSSLQGWVVGSFGTQTRVSEVCVKVFPTGKGRTAVLGRIEAYAGSTLIGSASGQGQFICVAKKKPDPYITRVLFSGNAGDAKFDNLRYR